VIGFQGHIIKGETRQGLLYRRRVTSLDTDRLPTVATLHPIRLDLLKEVGITIIRGLVDHHPLLIPADRLIRVALLTLTNGLFPIRMLPKT
jgi:hypothetical protein